MSAIHDLIAQISDPRLRERLTVEWANAAKEKKFGLVFEDHLPELLPLHEAKPRKGDLVCRRQGTLKDVWQIKSIRAEVATCVKPSNEAHPSEPTRAAVEPVQFAVDELLVVREFGEPIFPALVPVDAVANGPADAPWHTLIEADNYHALQLLDYLYAGQVDCIYIDPPYNTGARDWKYNNDYVDGNDGWRHSKWLAFMEKRLKLAKRLLNPKSSVLIVTIDENEVNHLCLVLDNLFPEATRQMVTSVINPRGVYKDGCFARCDEYLLFVMIGEARVAGEADSKFLEGADISWRTLRRSDLTSARGTAKGGARQFYPIYVNDATKKIEEIGEPLPHGVTRLSAPLREGCTAVFPIRPDGTEMNWGLTPESLSDLWRKGYVKLGAYKPNEPQKYVVSYLTSGRVADIVSGKATVVGNSPCGAVIAKYLVDKDRMPVTCWSRPTHNAETFGSNLLRDIVGDKRFPFPKSLYAVADCVRFFTKHNKSALVLDFFGGSGTTANAVMLLNNEDGGSRRCILVTNNEVSANDAEALRSRGLQAGDDEWEAQGICRSVTWLRSKFSILGHRDDGTQLPGEYLTGKTAAKEKARSFRQIGFVDPAQLDSQPKKKQVVALIDGLPQTLVKDLCPFIVSEDHKASVLFDPASAEDWLEALDGQEHITDFYIVTPVKRVFDQLKAQVVELLGPVLVQEEEKRPMSAGFPANLAYFKLDFLERERVSLRRAFREILPLLWLKAGAVGPRPELKRGEPEPALFEPEGSNFVVLLDETRMGRLLKSLEGRTGLSQVFIVTDADESFKTMAQDVREVAGKANPSLAVVQLYRDYLINFMINKNQDRAAGHTDTQGARA